MNILEAFDKANKGIDVKKPQVLKQEFNPVQQPGSIEDLPIIPNFGEGGYNNNVAPSQYNQTQQPAECSDDFDQVLSSVICQLKQVISSYDLDEEDHEKISSAIMKLDSLLDEEVKISMVAVQQTVQQQAPQQQVRRQGRYDDVTGYLRNM